MTQNIEQLVTLSPAMKEDLPLIKQELNTEFIAVLVNTAP